MAAGHGIRTIKADGNNVEEVSRISLEACKDIRQGSGSVFIELSTYRWREHCGHQYDNHIGYREQEEFLLWKKKDPIEIFRKKVSNLIDFESIDEFLEVEINEAFSKAKSDPFPEPDETYKNIYAINE